nr:MAG TPA: hypothetical protein [Caudoviricetes sp.]
MLVCCDQQRRAVIVRSPSASLIVSMAVIVRNANRPLDSRFYCFGVCIILAQQIVETSCL